MSGIFERSTAVLGDEAMACLAAARVLVVGVGGVGSWCAEALVRTGIGCVTLVDDDRVAESNVNRQCPATMKTLGRAKVEVMAERLLEINPAAKVSALAMRYPAEGEAPFDLLAFDLIVDAIDSVDSKARLILDAFAADVPIISSMGAALRTDPTKVELRRFEKVEGDGLAKALRNRFRKAGRWPGRFLCVCSSEPPLKLETRGSLMPVTATFGMCLASAAVESLRSVGTGSARRVVVSLGSNVEPRREFLEQALAQVACLPGTRLVAASEIEETEPVDVPAAFAEMKFLNQVAFFETSLPPLAFSRRLHRIEDALGRRRMVRNGPRTIDLDLICYEGVRLETPELTLPHPRAMQREFVTAPWKTLIRSEMKVRRAAVSAAERAAKSEALCDRLLDLLGSAKLVCCYEALKTELDLSVFVAACRQRGVRVVFPREIPPTDLSRKKDFVVDEAADVDLWICPGLAFTERGERLGFGGGWYDRFLSVAKADARTVGVAYAFQVVDCLPQGTWDRRLGKIVSV